MDVHPTKNGIFIGIDPYQNKSLEEASPLGVRGCDPLFERQETPLVLTSQRRTLPPMLENVGDKSPGKWYKTKHFMGI
jgi:hypothetical protein